MKKTESNNRRLKRERDTIEIMIEYYCKKNHNHNLCYECKILKNYAFERLLQCPFEESKPVCSNCTVHCYKPDMRKKVKDVMRFSGPRMIFKHPYLAFMHLINEKFNKTVSLSKK